MEWKIRLIRHVANHLAATLCVITFRITVATLDLANRVVKKEAEKKVLDIVSFFLTYFKDKRCEKPFDGCEHVCPRNCHDPQYPYHPTRPIFKQGEIFRTKVDQKAEKAALLSFGPRIRLPMSQGEKKETIFFFSPQLLFEVVCEPCPIIVSRMCVGSHKSFDKVCSSDPIFHCDGLCVGPLLCGNHFCEKGCHANKGPETCRQCERNCGHVLDCGHACPLKCHPKSTPHPICMVPIEFTCYCTLTTFELPCCDSKNANLVEEKKHCK